MATSFFDSGDDRVLVYGTALTDVDGEYLPVGRVSGQRFHRQGNPILPMYALVPPFEEGRHLFMLFGVVEQIDDEEIEIL